MKNKKNCIYEQGCENYSVAPYKVRVEWYDGSNTIETVIADDGLLLYLLYETNHSYFAPKEWCINIE